MASPPTSRHDARERAMSLLYEAEQKGTTVAEVLAQLPLAPDPYAEALARDADAGRDVALELIRRFCRDGWTVERLPLLDVIVLRTAIEELRSRPDVPRAVVLDEAVELAKTFSTEQSGSFVNGILTSIADELGR
jgi:transcription antitermination protein NusB